MIRRSRLRWCFVFTLIAAEALAAEAVVKPLPEADLSRLDPAQRSSLSATRKQFDQAKVGLVGDDLAEAFARMGAEYARYGFTDIATVAFEDAMALAPKDGRYVYLRGYLRLKSPHPATARADFELAAKLEPDYLPAQYRAAELALSQNDLASARKYYQGVADKHPELAPAWAGLGEVALREKRYADAIKHFEQALKLEPGADMLHARLAEALAGSGNSARAAEERAKAGTRLALYADPLGQGLEQLPPSGTVADQARESISIGNLERAVTLLDDALKANPADAGALAAYVRLELKRGDIGAAEKRADAALKLTPGSGDVLVVRGLVFEARGDDAQAQSYYSRAITADAHPLEARLLLGNSYIRQRRYPAAAEQFRFMSADVPDDPISLARLVAAYALAGRCNDGVKRAGEAVSARPRDGFAAQVFARAAASCSGASSAERTQALNLGKALYEQRPIGEHAEAYAMALAANGKAKESVDLEAQAMFDTVKNKDDALLAGQRAWLKRFEGGQPVELPWPQGSGFIDPPSAKQLITPKA